MSSAFRLPPRSWLIFPLCAFGFLVWTNYARMQRVEYVTNTDHEEAVVDAASPTGYTGGKRWLIVPEHNNRSYQWIAETQQMLANGEWRVRHVDYDNAPLGRAVYSASPYRWWLGLIAWVDHSISGRPIGLSVERAALWADPVLHLLLLLGTTLFVARCFGTFPAALLALGLATIYPLAGSFLPGMPDEHGLAWACGLWSVLPLLAGMGYGSSPARPKIAEIDAARTPQDVRRSRRLFFIAGVAGGFGLWISATNQAPLLVGIALGGLLARWISAGKGKSDPADCLEMAPWRLWALGGAAACLTSYLIEYFPAHLALRLQANHPLYGLAWVGVGELLAQAQSWVKHRKSFWNSRRIIQIALAVVAVAALPIVMRLSGNGLLTLGDQFASRLSGLPNGAVAKNFLAWIVRDGITPLPILATCAPLLLLFPAVWLLALRTTGVGQRTRIALVLGPVLVTLFLATRQLRWWNACDGMLLALLVVITATTADRLRWWWAGFVGLILLPGLIQLVPPSAAREKIEFTRGEVEGLIERALAHWIADRADPGGAVILVPPDRSTSLCFHGGLRGLGSSNWENHDGLAATVRIVTATTANEAQALISERGITHIILPSWDSDLDEFARWSLRNPEDAFISALHHWALPPWLRPLPYKLPTQVGFDNQSVVILKVIDESNPATALSRLAEYFIETEQAEPAASAAQALKRYPTDLGALVALAEVEKSSGDANGFARTFATLLTSLAAGADRTLPWDRRVSFAAVLAQGERDDLAREQVRICLDKLNETRIRSLTTASLFRLQILGKAFGMGIPDQKLRELAWRLLPPELRSRL